MTALVTALKARALALGLDRVGIASAGPFDAERLTLEQRRSQGIGPHEFEPATIEARVDPQAFLSGARTIIAAAMSYRMPPPQPQPLHGSFSMYCRGLDYHALMEERLEQLATWLRQQVPCRTRVHVDVDVPLDRAVAVRAGLGRMGKNTNVIAPHLGSWIFLGEIYTDAELPADPPLTGAICGSCTLCLDACPTGCLTEWSIDGARCLGSVNQVDGVMPAEYRAVMGDRLFGCDDCQDVCPHNVSAAIGLHDEYDAVAPADLVRLVDMSEDDFHAWFDSTAAAWRGRQVLQRNALVALGNSGDPAAFDPLCNSLRSPDALLRGHAAWALGRLAELAPGVASRVRQVLTDALACEADVTVREEISNAAR